jgi:hypothetical protein
MALDENESTIVPELIYNSIRISKHIVGIIVLKKEGGTTEDLGPQ